MRNIIAAAAMALLAQGASAATITTITNQVNAGFEVSSTDLLQTQLAASSFDGSFTQEGALGSAAFTNGIYGGQSNQGALYTGNASQAATADASNTAVFALTGVFDLTSIDTYAGWDGNRGGQSYTVSYATSATPYQWIELATVFNDVLEFGNNNSHVQLTGSDGVLASDVVSLMFQFGGDLTLGYAGYREIDVQGTPSDVPEPASLALLGLGLAGMAARRKRSKPSK